METPPAASGLNPLLHVEPASAAQSSADPRHEQYARLEQLALGKEQLATVLARLSNGQFLVRIADTAARMSLPAGTQTGSDIRLTLIATKPRPTFLLGASPAGDSSVTEVSDTGRLIDRMRQHAQGLPGRIVSGTPLLAAAPAATAGLSGRLADALRNMLDRSGLFYESHVGEWLNRERPLHSLLQEPQARLMQMGAADAASTAPDAEKRLAERYPGTGSASLCASDPADAAPQANTVLAKSPSDDPELARLVSLQLDLLEKGHVSWEGELWPGLSLQWEVGKDEGGRGNQAAQTSDGDVPCWQSRIRCDFPRLGMVAATIRLRDSHVSIELSAAIDSTVALLRAEGRLLADALLLSGSSLNLMTVKQDGHL